MAGAPPNPLPESIISRVKDEAPCDHSRSCCVARGPNCVGPETRRRRASGLARRGRYGRVERGVATGKNTRAGGASVKRAGNRECLDLASRRFIVARDGGFPPGGATGSTAASPTDTHAATGVPSSQRLRRVGFRRWPSSRKRHRGRESVGRDSAKRHGSFHCCPHVCGFADRPVPVCANGPGGPPSRASGGGSSTDSSRLPGFGSRVASRGGGVSDFGGRFAAGTGKLSNGSSEPSPVARVGGAAVHPSRGSTRGARRQKKSGFWPLSC